MLSVINKTDMKIIFRSNNIIIIAHDKILTHIKMFKESLYCFIKENIYNKNIMDNKKRSLILEEKYEPLTSVSKLKLMTYSDHTEHPMASLYIKNTINENLLNKDEYKKKLIEYEGLLEGMISGNKIPTKEEIEKEIKNFITSTLFEIDSNKNASLEKTEKCLTCNGSGFILTNNPKDSGGYYMLNPEDGKTFVFINSTANKEKKVYRSCFLCNDLKKNMD